MHNYIEKKKGEITPINIICLLFAIFLPVFSFGIFAPTEIFFANYQELGIIYSDFGSWFWKTGLVITLLTFLVLLLLPLAVSKWLLCLAWIFSLAAYVQTMFLNGNMDRVGESTFGYQPDTAVVVKDLAVWLFVIVVALLLFLRSKENWSKLLLFTSLVLIATQMIAYISLFQTAEEEAFEIHAEGELALDGSKRFELSSKENVVVFVLDSAANFFYDEWMLAEYPEAESILKDFTYYNNAESLDYGTFPSATHLVTGYPFEPTSGVNQYFEEAWTSDSMSKFLTDMHANGYKIRLYEYADYTFIGDLGLEFLQDKVDNVAAATAIREVNQEKVYETLWEMACYRFLPDAIKNRFNVTNEQYATLVSTPENVIEWANPDFLINLRENGGLDLTGEDKYLTYYFLDGVHEIINDENCERIPAEEATQESISKSLRGCWKLLEEYINYMKEAGVYHKSTIIVTADHGVPYNNQPIFFIKKAGQKQNQIQVTTAPITWNEIMPTIAQCAGLNGHDYGETVYDYQDGEERTRSVGVRAEDSNYPLVDCYNGMSGVANLVYHMYSYTGNRMAWRAEYEGGNYETVPATEAFYY